MDFCFLFIFNLCLTFSNIQRINNVGKGLINGIVLERSAICTDSHMNRNGVTTRVLPVRNAGWYFEILHVLFGQLPRWRSMKWWRRRPWSRRQFSVFMLRRQKGINLNMINSNDPFFITLSSLSLGSKPYYFRLSLS